MINKNPVVSLLLLKIDQLINDVKDLKAVFKAGSDKINQFMKELRTKNQQLDAKNEELKR
jgi:outer membrane murein-binding lipoprotein Lpp